MTTALTAASTPSVLSRDTGALRRRWNIGARNLNAWCRIPGSPFAPGFLLMPNPPQLEHVSVWFEPLELPPALDTLTFLFRGVAQREHANTIDVHVAVLDSSGQTLCESTTWLSYRDSKCATLTVPTGQAAALRLRLGVSFREFVDSRVHGRVDIRYALAYARNELADLFNAAGSDKGTEVTAGDGVPHCYALDYHRLFQVFRDDAFNLLEIGLDNASPPADAPSLRAWREFFPNARIYGYDIEDLGRFLRGCDMPQFRVVVDDGSHASSHQQISLATLFPHVEPLGLYVIEDLGWQPFPESPTTLQVLQTFLERATFESPFIAEAEARYLEDTVGRIEFCRPNDDAFAVIQKKDAAR